MIELFNFFMIAIPSGLAIILYQSIQLLKTNKYEKFSIKRRTSKRN